MARLILVLALGLAFGCGGPSSQDPLRKQRETGLEHAKRYRIDHNAKGGAILDGDTVLLEGLGNSVRLVGVDAEEVFKGKKDEEAARKDFAQYALEARRGKKNPVKFGTPAGMAGKAFAEAFFRDVKDVLYVPDDPRQPKDFYDRYLGHLLVDRDGDGNFTENFAVELVRHGHSPYFVKYGATRMFRGEFEAAEREARATKAGIWSEAAGIPAHYPDYPERLAWWHRRAKALEEFSTLHEGDPKFFRLNLADELARLVKMAKASPGAAIYVFGAPTETVREDGARVTGYLAHQNRRDIPVVCASKSEWEKLNLLSHLEEYVYVAGRIWPSGEPAGVEIRVDETTRILKSVPRENR